MEGRTSRLSCKCLHNDGVHIPPRTSLSFRTHLQWSWPSSSQIRMFPGFGGAREKPSSQHESWCDFKRKSLIFLITCGALTLLGKSEWRTRFPQVVTLFPIRLSQLLVKKSLECWVPQRHKRQEFLSKTIVSVNTHPDLRRQSLTGRTQRETTVDKKMASCFQRWVQSCVDTEP